MRLLRYLGLLAFVMITCSIATSIAERSRSLQLEITSSITHLPNIPNSDTTPRIRRRAFDRVPGLPAGWKAIYDVITDLRGIPRPSQRRILEFYDMILDAAYQNTLGPDTVRKTFHLGNLVLQFQSRRRDQTNVTRELVIATIGILLTFGETGFIDLFKARLEHELDDLAVHIVLSVTDRVIEGFTISGGNNK